MKKATLIQNYRHRMHIGSIHTAVLLLLGCGLFSACVNDYKVDERQLTVSIEPLRYITEAIVGDCYDVTTLTPEGVSPETYMPTPQQMTSINNGSAYIFLGALGFEQQHMEKILETCPHLYVINVSENIQLMPDGDGCHASDGADPHIWTSPKNMKMIASNIHKALCHMDTANTATFDRNLDRFHHHLDSVDKVLHNTMKDVKNRTFLINHPALAYFAAQYGFRQLSVEHDGKEASAERVAHLIDECRKEGVKTIFVQKQNSDRTTKRIAEELGVETVKINPLAYRWEEEMYHIAKSFK